MVRVGSNPNATLKPASYLQEKRARCNNCCIDCGASLPIHYQSQRLAGGLGHLSTALKFDIH